MSAERHDAAALLDSLRWREDQIVTNHDGVRVWLKALFVDGTQTGITDCYSADDPCERHAALAANRERAS